MLFDKPISFKIAVKMLADKELLPTSASSAQLEQLRAEIHERSVISARVQNADFLQRFHDLTQRMVNPSVVAGRPAKAGEYMDRARFREEMKNYLQSIAYTPEPGKEGTLQDLSSDARLNVIADMNVRSALGYGRWVKGNEPGALEAFPAQELYRRRQSKAPRDWWERWVEAGESVGWEGASQDKMIALKTSPIWTAISRFGTPYPPFDFNSGMSVRSISRSEAVDAGLINPDAQLQPAADRSFNDGLQASAEGLAQPLLSTLLESIGPAWRLVQGVLHYVGG